MEGVKEISDLKEDLGGFRYGGGGGVKNDSMWLFQIRYC